MEYVTDPVLYVPRLRCPACSETVRQIREAASPSDNVWVIFTEPICWVILGIAALLGVFLQAVFALAFGILFCAPVLVVILYLRGLKKASFLCVSCGREASFSEVTQRRGR